MIDRSRSPTIYLITADVSGDQNGGRLAEALRRQMPRIKLVGVGGQAMRRAGVEVVIESSEASMVGPPDSLTAIRSLRRVWKDIRRLLAENRPDAAVLIDNETLNLLIARRLRRNGVPTAFFFPPQVWFWGRWRMRWILSLSPRLLCAFKQEAEIYRAAGADATWIGHPLRDVVHVYERPTTALHRLNLDPKDPIVVLMPGSRRQELRANCRTILAAAEILQARDPALQFAIPLASASLQEQLETEVRRSKLRRSAIYPSDNYAVVSSARIVIQCSGTATLETALLGIPSIILYQCSRLRFAIARRAMHVKFIGMVNILLGEMVQPEFFETHIDPKRLADEAWSLLWDDTRRDAIKKRLTALPEMLGAPGALDRAAASVLALLHEPIGSSSARTDWLRADKASVTNNGGDRNSAAVPTSG
jgi:lipid-A-disaccharide synthase